MADVSLVVMAAGMGSRYGGLKQIDPVGPNGELVMHYSVYDALRAGFARVVFIIRRDFEAQFRDRIGRTVERLADTRYVFQSIEDLPAGFSVPSGRRKPWGTGQAILCAREAVDTSFLVINADDFYGQESYRIMAGFLRERPLSGPTQEYAMAGYRLANTLSEHGHVTRAVCRANEEGYLAGIREVFKIRRLPEGVMFTENDRNWLPLPADSLVSMNFWGFPTSIFEELEARFPAFLRRSAADIDRAEFLIPEVVGEIVREGRARVRILPTPAKWFGVTYPEDRPRVQAAVTELIRQGVYPAELWPES